MYFLRGAIIIIIIFVSLKLYYIFNDLDEGLQYHAVANEPQKDISESIVGPDDKKEVGALIDEISVSEAQALMHLSARHKELQKLEVDLRDKESLLEATQQHVASRVIELEALEKNVKKLLQAYQQADEEKIRSLVKIYENMKPQDAAQIFDDLDLNTVLQVIDHMKETKIAPLLAKMRPDKARQITMKFADNYGKLNPRNYNLCICE